jgi:hypothetical protein
MDLPSAGDTRSPVRSATAYALHASTMAPLTPGTVVGGRFEVLRAAGSGGMGVVHQARDRLTDRTVALKVLLERDPGPADRFAHEVELLSALDHPHIVGYVAHGVTEGGEPYLVMPWLDGTDLQARLRAGPLTVDETLGLARNVADALEYLHGRGLVHRDLKPSNLFLSGGRVEEVKVIDLGVARESVAKRALTLSGVLIGTPGFIAPEQARGDREVAPAVDIFALGCVLFECLTGQRLFTGSHLMSVLAQILLEDAPRVRELRPSVPAALDLLVHRMVAKEPEKRPLDGAQLARWLSDMGRAPEDDSVPSQRETLTASERRVVTVLVVVLPAARLPLRPPGAFPPGAARPDEDETWVEADPLRASAARFGLRARMVAEGTVIVLTPPGVNAADQASLLTRFAGHIAETSSSARLALATGSAITGSRLPVGEAIDRAVTMVRSATAASGVQVDDVTAGLIASRFVLRREGDWLVVEDERLSVDPARPLLGRPTSCVGRERELTLLETTFDDCDHGDGPKLVLVTAAAGAGKSRLRHELVRRLHAREAKPRVLVCRGDPLHAATPYAIIAQAVRQAAGLRERDAPERVREQLRRHVDSLVAKDAARVGAFLGELVGAASDDDGGLPLHAARHDPLAMDDQVGRAFEDILRAWCAPSLVLVLDDLHWGDFASMKLLDHALRKLTGVNLFLLALARPEVHERFPALFAQRDVLEVRLPPIPRRACTKLVRDVMGDGPSAAEVARIVARSDGNAFYLEELIRAAAERAEGVSSPPPSSSAGRTARRSDAPSRLVDLPETVIAVAQARLERLEPDVRKVLRAASVFGDVFWLEGVSALVGSPPSLLQAIIDALVDQEAIAPSERPHLAGAQELCFRHTLLRGTAYATLTEEDRLLGHRLAAAWLEQVQEDDEIIAAHWLDGGDKARSAASFTRAGERRWSRAHADAAARCAARALLVGDAGVETTEAISARVRLLASALGATRRLDAPDVIAGLEERVPSFDPRAPGAGRGVVEAALERSLAPLRTRGDGRALPLILAQAACALGALSDFAGARQLLTEARERATEIEPQLRHVAYASAKVAFWSGDGGAAVALLAETVLPEDEGARTEMLLILAMAVVHIDGRAALARGLDFVSRAEAILGARLADDAPHREDPVALVQVAKARFFCFFLAGEYARAAEEAERAVVIARRAGLRFDECAHLHNAAEQYLRLGERDRARATLLDSNRIARDIGADRSERQNEVLLAHLDGRADLLALLAATAQGARDAWLELNARYWLGTLFAERGAPEARRELERALNIATELKICTVAASCARAIAAL